METQHQCKDSVTIKRIESLHPKLRFDVTKAIIEAESRLPKNCMIRIVQGLRTIEEQNALYAQGRTVPGKIVTNAKGGSSYHNYGLAVDFVLMYDKDGNGTYETVEWKVNADWQAVVSVFESMDFEWGGRWEKIKDYPHFQKTYGYNWRQLLSKYQDKDFITGTQYVNL